MTDKKWEIRAKIRERLCNEESLGLVSLRNTMIEVDKALEDIELVDLVEVPSIVDDWILGHDDLAPITQVRIIWKQWGEQSLSPELGDYFNNHGEIVMRAILDGYVVEKLPLYYVLFPETATAWKYAYLARDGSHGFSDEFPEVDLLTEEQIKNIDKRYLCFAKPIEEDNKK